MNGYRCSITLGAKQTEICYDREQKRLSSIRRKEIPMSMLPHAIPTIPEGRDHIKTGETYGKKTTNGKVGNTVLFLSSLTRIFRASHANRLTCLRLSLIFLNDRDTIDWPRNYLIAYRMFLPF